MEENDIPKYRKRRTKETPKKSDHKHVYDKQVLFYYVIGGRDHYSSGYVCSTCGKPENLYFTERDQNGFLLTNEQVLPKYKHLEIVEYKL